MRPALPPTIRKNMGRTLCRAWLSKPYGGAAIRIQLRQRQGTTQSAGHRISQRRTRQAVKLGKTNKRGNVIAHFLFAIFTYGGMR